MKDAFYNFWTTHPKTPLFPYAGTAIEPYKNNVPRVPNICIKVPTAGGKTFIACNAIKTIFDAFAHARRRQQLQEIGGSVVKSSFVLRIKFGGGRQFCTPKSPTSCSCKTIAVIVKQPFQLNNLQ